MKQHKLRPATDKNFPIRWGDQPPATTARLQADLVTPEREQDPFLRNVTWYCTRRRPETSQKAQERGVTASLAGVPADTARKALTGDFWRV